MGRTESRSQHHKPRRDGWTAGRQLRFLAALARTRSVTQAAAFAGMSRESAYRLRRRPGAGLFAAAWDNAVARSHGRKLRFAPLDAQTRPILPEIRQSSPSPGS